MGLAVVHLTHRCDGADGGNGNPGTHRVIQEWLLQSHEQLPDSGVRNDLEFVWDHEGGDERPTTLIRLRDGKVVWTERAYLGCKQRFLEVERLLMREYGSGFWSLEVDMSDTDCGLYDYGDSARVTAFSAVLSALSLSQMASNSTRPLGVRWM